MAIQTINLGTYANDGTGDDLRTAFQKVNANFIELGASDVRNGVNVGPDFITLTTVSATSNADTGLSTLTFAEQSVAPFAVGESITVTGVTPAGFNGTWAVVECTTTSVSFVGATTGPMSVAGQITSNIGKIFSQRNTNAELEFKTVTSGDGSIVITETDETVNLKAQAKLENDPLPTVVAPVYRGPILTNPFNLNGNVVINGDVETTVYGINLQITNSIIELLLLSNQLSIDFGSFLVPTGSKGASGDKGLNLDFGSFIDGHDQNTIDFGAF